MLWSIRYVTIIKSKMNKHCFSKMSKNNQHKYTRCHFSIMVIALIRIIMQTPMNHVGNFWIRN